MNAYLIKCDDDPAVVLAENFSSAIQRFLQQVHAENIDESDFEYTKENIHAVELLGEIYNWQQGFGD